MEKFENILEKEKILIISKFSSFSNEFEGISLLQRRYQSTANQTKVSVEGNKVIIILKVCFNSLMVSPRIKMLSFQSYIRLLAVLMTMKNLFERLGGKEEVKLW